MDPDAGSQGNNVFQAQLTYNPDRDSLRVRFVDRLDYAGPYRYWTMDSWDRIWAQLDEENCVIGYTVCPLRMVIDKLDQGLSHIWLRVGVPEDHVFEVDGKRFDFIQLLRWVAQKA